jgi:hypothetical protein
MESSTPESSGPEANKYAELSHWCIGQANDYLRRRNNVQASEKGWGAAAQALKAIAEERGWNHDRHPLLFDVVGQVNDERRRARLNRLFGVANEMHVNFYEDWLAESDVQYGIDTVKVLVERLDRVRKLVHPGLLYPEMTVSVSARRPKP